MFLLTHHITPRNLLVFVSLYASALYPCLITATPSTGQNAKSASKIFSLVAPSTVVIVAYDSNANKIGQGSGIVLPDKLVATNCHVTEDASHITVEYDGTEYRATERFADTRRDVCILHASTLEAPAVVLGSTEKLLVGQRVYAVGAPRGLELSLSEGIISSLRNADGGRYIQTTAPISLGSSGGGLYDENGNVIGLTTFYLSDSQNLNFALPVEWVINAMMRRGSNDASGESLTTWLNEATALQEKQDWRGLLGHSKRWTRTMPEKAVAWTYLGDAYLSLEQYEQSIAAFQQAININPDAYAWFKLGVAYGKLGRHIEAENAYKESLRIDPENSWTWHGLGYTYGMLGKYAESITAAQQALRIDPRLINAWVLLGMGYDETDQHDKAREVYLMLKSIAPDVAKRFSQLENSR